VFGLFNAYFLVFGFGVWGFSLGVIGGQGMIDRFVDCILYFEILATGGWVFIVFVLGFYLIVCV